MLAIRRQETGGQGSDLYVVAVEVQGRDLDWFPEKGATTGVDVVAPGSSATFRGRWEGPDGPGTGSSTGKVDVVNARIQFADSSGVWWQRASNADVIRSATPAARKAVTPTWKPIDFARTVPDTQAPTDTPAPTHEHPVPAPPADPGTRQG